MTLLALEPAYAKINLCLFLGPTRADGRHELVTLFDSLTLADELEVMTATRDEVVCEGVAGPNLVSDALSALRAAGWDAPPVRVVIRKRIPVAGGMGGGSADAAAMLRLAPRLGGGLGRSLRRIAASLGADVPAQVNPGPSIGTGAGHIVAPLAALPPYGVLVLAQPFALSTADVYREADRLGLVRAGAELASRRDRLTAVLPGALPPELIVNDLQPAAISLAPALHDALSAAGGAGADHVLVCGSGPTVIGVFVGEDGADRASAVADRLRDDFPAALASAPLRGGVRGATPNE